jgi:hypothetical protein
MVLLCIAACSPQVRQPIADARWFEAAALVLDVFACNVRQFVQVASVVIAIQPRKLFDDGVSRLQLWTAVAHIYIDRLLDWHARFYDPFRSSKEPGSFGLVERFGLVAIPSSWKQFALTDPLTFDDLVKLEAPAAVAVIVTCRHL